MLFGSEFQELSTALRDGTEHQSGVDTAEKRTGHVELTEALRVRSCATHRISAGARQLPKARAKIASQQGFDPSLFKPPREVDHVRRQLLRQEKLAPALDVVPPTAFDGPTPPGEDPGHLVATQVRPRGPAMAEAMPDKSEAVRVDI